MIREYSSISIETTLSSGMTSVQTSLIVSSGTGSALLGGVTLSPASTYQFTLAIDPDTANEEIVFATFASGDTFTVQRGQAQSTAITHAAGAIVRHVLTASDLDYFNTAIQPSLLTAKGDLITATASGTATVLAAGVNGYILSADSTQAKGIKWIASPVGDVTLTGTQTLTNKTLTSPIITTPKTTIGFTTSTASNYTLLVGDRDKLVTLSNASANTLTIPNGIFAQGDSINVQQIGAGQTTIQGDGTATFTSTGTKLRTQYSAATIICTGTNTFTVVGDLV